MKSHPNEPDAPGLLYFLLHHAGMITGCGCSASCWGSLSVMNMLTTNSHALADARYSADPDDISAQIDLIGGLSGLRRKRSHSARRSKTQAE
jgi:hypothetical protein